MLHGYNPPHRYLPYLSWTEIADLPDKENTVIVEGGGTSEAITGRVNQIRTELLHCDVTRKDPGAENARIPVAPWPALKP